MRERRSNGALFCYSSGSVLSFTDWQNSAQSEWFWLYAYLFVCDFNEAYPCCCTSWLIMESALLLQLVSDSGVTISQGINALSLPRFISCLFHFILRNMKSTWIHWTLTLSSRCQSGNGLGWLSGCDYPLQKSIIWKQALTWLANCKQTVQHVVLPEVITRWSFRISFTLPTSSALVIDISWSSGSDLFN